MISKALIILLTINFISGRENLASKFKLCSRSDSNLNECLKMAISNALPILKTDLSMYDLPPLDPIRIPEWTVTALSPLNFDQNYQNMELLNAFSSEILDVNAKIGDATFSFSIKMRNEEFVVVADYNYQNAIFDDIDMSSMGKCRFIIKEYSGTYLFNGEIQENRLLITNVTASNLNIALLSLFYESDDKETAQILTKHFNDNWLTLFKREGAKYTAMYAEGFKRTANSVFSVIPYDVLFPL